MYVRGGRQDVLFEFILCTFHSSDPLMVTKKGGYAIDEIEIKDVTHRYGSIDLIGLRL